MSMDEIRDRARALADGSYRSIEWKGVGDTDLAEMPAIPDWLPSLAFRREFGDEIGGYDPAKDDLKINPKVRYRIESLVLDIMALFGEGSNKLAMGALELPPVEAEAHYAISFFHARSVAPDWADLNDDQAEQAALFQGMQLITFWLTQVIIMRARELRLEERTRG